MSNEWKEYQMFVLQELERLNNNVEKMETKLDCLSNDTSVLKVKAGIWGVIGGSIPVVIAIGLYVLQEFTK